MWRNTVLTLMLIMTLGFSACSPAPQTQPTITTLSEPAETPTQVPTQTPTPSPTPTEPPTPTATPTQTPTPQPTATPMGYYSNESAGFSLVHPPDWEISDEDSSGTFLEPEELAIYFYGSRLSQDYYSENYEEIFPLLLADLEYLEPGYEVLSETEMQTADGNLAQVLTISYLYKAVPCIMKLMVTSEGNHAYAFLVDGTREAMNRKQATIDSLLASIQLYGDLLYGLKRDQMIVQRGIEPLAQDLDPALTTESAADYVGHLFSGLVRISPALQVEPDLTESWVISPNGTEYTFTLRDGITFQSGKPITAQDFIYSWERATSPEIDSPTAGTYLIDILGVREKLSGEAEEITGLKAQDERTLVVTLDGPKPYFLAKLTYPNSYVVDRENVEAGGQDWVFNPNASGPFILQSFDDDDALIFASNPGYYQPPAVPYLVYLLYRSGSGLSYYESGEIDLTAPDAAAIEEIQSSPENPLHDQLYSTTSLCTRYLAFNNTNPPMDDVQVRKAFVQAVDRDWLVKQFSDDLDLRADTLLPPAMPGHNSSPVNIPFDPEAARAALKASQYGETLPPITLTFMGYGDSENPFYNAIIDMWRENLGVEIIVEYADPDRYPDSFHAINSHIAGFGWCADYPDPENFLDILFHSASNFNVVGYKNPEIDGLLEEARVTIDPARRITLYQQVEKLLLEDAALLPLVHFVDFMLVKPQVSGYVLMPAGIPIMHLLTLEAKSP